MPGNDQLSLPPIDAVLVNGRRWAVARVVHGYALLEGMVGPGGVHTVAAPALLP